MQKTQGMKVQSYNSIRDELQNQNAILMKERYNITQQIQAPSATHPQSSILTQYNQRTQYDMSPNYTNHSPAKNYQQTTNILDTLKYKVEEVIQLCQGHEKNTNQFAQLEEVAQIQRQVLTFLNGIGEQDMPSSKRRSSSSKKKGSHKKKPKLNKTQAYQPQNFQLMRNYIGDQALQMIQDIQRKALLQIESLRMDKINLMKKLNEEIKAHNQQKKIRLKSQQGRAVSQNINKTQRQQRQQPMQMQVVAQQNENQSNYQAYNQGTSVHGGYINQGARPQSQRKMRPQANQPKQYSQFHPNAGVKFTISQPMINSVVPSKQQIGSQQQIIQQLQKLKYENQRIKSTISTGNSGNAQRKMQLRTQLGQLQAKIHQYEGILSLSKRGKGSFNMAQFQNLLSQANQITEHGNKLLRNKQARTTLGSYQVQDDQLNKSFGNKNKSRVSKAQDQTKGGRATFDYTRPPLQTFSPMDKSFHSQNYKVGNNGFSPSQYQNVIQQMRNAMSN